MAAVDRFTKFFIAQACSEDTAEVVAKFINKEIVLNFGVPDEIHTDRGTNFMSEVVVIYLNEQGIKHVKTSAFHPRTNGKLERLNGFIGEMLTKYCNGQIHRWGEYLDNCVFAYKI